MSLRDDLILQAQLYAESAPVAQRTEHWASNPGDAGSTPVGGASQRVHAALEGFAGIDRRMARQCDDYTAVDGWVGPCTGKLDDQGVCARVADHADPDQQY